MGKRRKYRIAIAVAAALLLQAVGCGVGVKDVGSGGQTGKTEEAQIQEQPEKAEAGSTGNSGTEELEASGTESQGMEKTEAGGTESRSEEHVQPAVQHLLEAWSEYLGVLDQIYGSELWAFDYVDAYFESGEWRDLTKARSACIVSAQLLDEFDAAKEGLSEKDLSEEEYVSLAGAGIDTGYQTMDFSSVGTLLEDAQTTVGELLLEGMECDVFLKCTAETLKELVDVKRDQISGMCRYYCNETNYLLLTLGEYIDAGEYWGAMQKDFPAVFAGYGEWMESEAEAKSAASANLDDYEEAVLRHSDLYSQMQANAYKIGKIVGEGDKEAYREEMYAISNTPGLLPEPIWYAPEETEYRCFLQGEDGKVRYPKPGDDLADEGYGMYLRIEGVSEEEAAFYAEMAGDYAERVWKGEREPSAWYIQMPDYHVEISWKEDAVTIIFQGEDVTFAPLWYVEK